MFKKLSITLATVVSLIAIYQAGIVFTSTFAKASDLNALRIEMKINVLKSDTQYIQNKIWDMEDRYGYKELNEKSNEISIDVVHRYWEYRKQLDNKTDELKMLMEKRLKMIGD